MSKAELRERAIHARRALKSDDLSRLSLQVEVNLFELPEFQSARTIASYVAKKDEIQTRSIIERALGAGKRIVVPRTDLSRRRLIFYQIRGLTELSLGSFGVMEPGSGSSPVPLKDCQVVLVPLLGWDDRGHRLGYGKGLFDSELAHRGSCLAIGLALESQHLTHLPESKTDVPLDMVVTENRIVRFGTGSEADSR